MAAPDKKEPEVFRILGKGTRNLPCPLPEDEVIETAHQIGDLDAEAEKIEEEMESHKEIVKGLKLQLETKTVEMREKARIVRSGSVQRAVDIRTEISPDSTTIQVIREDTGEVIEERPSTPDERQGKLFNENIAQQVQAAIEGGKEDSKELDLSPLTPEEQARKDAEAEAYLKQHGSKKRKHSRDPDEDEPDEE